MEKNSTNQLVSYQQLREAIAISLGLSNDDIWDKSKLTELADSLEMAQLILDLEEDFHTQITDDDLKNLFTVQDVLDFLNGPRSYKN